MFKEIEDAILNSQELQQKLYQSGFRGSIVINVTPEGKINRESILFQYSTQKKWNRIW